MTSSSRRARQAPVADASWPIDRCMVPYSRPRANISSTASSKRRMAHMVASTRRASSLDPASLATVPAAVGLAMVSAPPGAVAQQPVLEAAQLQDGRAVVQLDVVVGQRLVDGD